MNNNDFREGPTKPEKVSASRISVIKFEGNNNVFVWKHPIEDFNSGSQLIVHESQEAIFFLNGQALDTFGPGRYTLETENLPFLRKLQTLSTGGENPFHAEIYFINKTVQMSLPWGTAEKIRFVEPETEVPIKIGAYGKMNLQVSDGRKLLIKLVGTTDNLLWGNKDEWMPEEYSHTLKQYFNPLIQTVVKANLASVIKNEGIDIFEIDEQLEKLSASLREKISAGFEEYGLWVPQFYVTSVSLPENGEDRNFEIIKKLRTEKLHIRDKEYEAAMVAAHRKIVLEQEATEIEQAKLDVEKKKFEVEAELLKKSVDVEIERRKGLVQAEIMQAQGYTKKDELAADVQKAYAAGIGQMGSNGGGTGGGSGVVSEILGLGVGMAAMGTIGEKVGDVMKDFGGGMSGASQQSASSGWKCSCGCEDNKGKFCSECGKAKPELWTCTACGATDNKGKFCSECGAAKAEMWDCPKCGAKENKGKFCSECGEKKEDN